MLTDIIIFLISLSALIWSADRFIFGASSIAKLFGISPYIIGLTIAAFGTSLPEVVIALTASIKHNPNLAVGNAIGSNIANIGLVLSIIILITQLPIKRHHERDFIFLFIVMAIVGVMFYFKKLFFIDGLILLAIAAGWIGWIGAQLKQKHTIPLDVELPDNKPVPASRAIAITIISLIILPISSEFMVRSSVSIAQHFGVSDFVIGLTIVAIGTSIPELAVSLAGALKKHHDIAIGNIIGSNVLNLLIVLPIPALVDPQQLPKHLLSRDFTSMTVMTVLLLLMMIISRRSSVLKRWQGLLLFLCYAGYMATLI